MIIHHQKKNLSPGEIIDYSRRFARFGYNFLYIKKKPPTIKRYKTVPTPNNFFFLFSQLKKKIPKKIAT